MRCCYRRLRAGCSEVCFSSRASCGGSVCQVFSYAVSFVWWWFISGAFAALVFSPWCFFARWPFSRDVFCCCCFLSGSDAWCFPPDAVARACCLFGVFVLWLSLPCFGVMLFSLSVALMLVFFVVVLFVWCCCLVVLLVRCCFLSWVSVWLCFVWLCFLRGLFGRSVFSLVFLRGGVLFVVLIRSSAFCLVCFCRGVVSAFFLLRCFCFCGNIVSAVRVHLCVCGGVEKQIPICLRYSARRLPTYGHCRPEVFAPLVLSGPALHICPRYSGRRLPTYGRYWAYKPSPHGALRPCTFRLSTLLGP